MVERCHHNGNNGDETMGFWPIKDSGSQLCLQYVLEYFGLYSIESRERFNCWKVPIRVIEEHRGQSVYHGTKSKPSSISGENVAPQRYCKDQDDLPKLMRGRGEKIREATARPTATPKELQECNYNFLCSALHCSRLGCGVGWQGGSHFLQRRICKPIWIMPKD